MEKKVENYFGRKAGDYEKKSNSFPWAYFRGKERKHLFSLVSYEKFAEILEIGCGSGFYSKILKENYSAQITALEPSSEMAKNAAPYCIKIHQGRLLDYSPSCRFAHIFCAGALEFMPSLDAAFEKISNLSHPGARLVLLYPKSIGIIGLIYKWQHNFGGCPVWLSPSKVLIEIALKYGLELKSHTSSGLISDLFLFEKRADFPNDK